MLYHRHPVGKESWNFFLHPTVPALLCHRIPCPILPPPPPPSAEMLGKLGLARTCDKNSVHTIHRHERPMAMAVRHGMLAAASIF